MPTDQITLQRIQILHPKVISEVTQIYNEIVTQLTGKAICRFSYTLRTYTEQNALYAKGRTAPGPIVTHARGGRSYHNFGLAFDIVLLKDTNGDGTFETASWETNIDFDKDGKPDWREVVTIAKAFGWEWGGDWAGFKDLPHFQRTFGHSTIELDQMVQSNRIITVNGNKFPNI